MTQSNCLCIRDHLSLAYTNGSQYNLFHKYLSLCKRPIHFLCEDYFILLNSCKHNTLALLTEITFQVELGCKLEYQMPLRERISFEKSSIRNHLAFFYLLLDTLLYQKIESDVYAFEVPLHHQTMNSFLIK